MDLTNRAVSRDLILERMRLYNTGEDLELQRIYKFCLGLNDISDDTWVHWCTGATLKKVDFAEELSFIYNKICDGSIDSSQPLYVYFKHMMYKRINSIINTVPLNVILNSKSNTDGTLFKDILLKLGIVANGEVVPQEDYDETDFIKIINKFTLDMRSKHISRRKEYGQN